MTGTTRDGTFLIEDGRIGRPLQATCASPTRSCACSRPPRRSPPTQRLVAEAEFYGRRFATGVVTPALRAQGFRITGQTL